MTLSLKVIVWSLFTAAALSAVTNAIVIARVVLVGLY